MTENAVGVKFVDLEVIRNDRPILQNISATVPCGSATVIVGPNGAGKTTLLRCMLGEIAYTGSIKYFRCDSSEENHISKNISIGYVPQHLQADAQLPLLVHEFLALGETSRPLWLGCSRRHRERARELLSLVDAEKLGNRRLGALSGGEMRRVLLAAALGRHPGLLVLDEAEAGVDYRGERLFWELLDKSRALFGFTLLMVTHNLPLAAHYATNVICIKKTVLAAGAPRATLTAKNLLELFGVPIHLYPNQCDDAGEPCRLCGALGNQPYNGLATDPDLDEKNSLANTKSQ